MSILWRYLLSQYLKVFCLCVFAFISILLTTRLGEIAHFATLGSEGIMILWFTLYQIPYILPIAIPISCLISIAILIQRLSHTHELTAFRSCGLSIRMILTPILLAGTCIAILNFYIASELATHSHLRTNLIKNELRSVNPLLLLHNKHLMRMKGLFFNTMGASRLGEKASHVVIAMPNRNNTRINVLFAENLEATPLSFKGSNVTLVTSLHPEHSTSFDHMLVENIGENITSIKDFSQMVQKKVLNVNNDHLRLSLLHLRLNEEKQALQQAESVSQQKAIKRSISRIYSEMVRRISIAVAALTFTLMGAAFGISISRNRSNRGLYFVVTLATLYIIAFFAAKGIDHHLIASVLLYLVPHLIIIVFSIWMLSRVSRGIE